MATGAGAVPVKHTLRIAAILFVSYGAAAAWIGMDRDYAQRFLVLGILCALLFLWLDWRDR